MVHDLDMKTSGLKALPKSRDIANNAMVASMLIQQAKR